MKIISSSPKATGTHLHLISKNVTHNILYVLLAGALIVSCQSNKRQNERTDNNTQTPHQVAGKTVMKSLGISVIKNILSNLKGTESNGMYKVTVPQNDLNVKADGFQIIPPMGLGSWIAFAPSQQGAMIMGDVVVTESDLWPVEQEVIRQGLSVTAIHNHFIRMEPDIWYMHIGGAGDTEKLAESVKSIFNKVAEVRGGNPADGPKTEVKNTLDTAMIANIIGQSGKMNRGVYKVTIGRPDVKLTAHGAPVNTFMGFNIWASWQGTSEKAAVAGDFTMLAGEVDPVIKALVEHNIEVVALHNHMVQEKPRIFFLHYWGTGPAEKLAKGLRAALDQTGIKQ